MAPTLLMLWWLKIRQIRQRHFSSRLAPLFPPPHRRRQGFAFGLS
jgi:hypothetical protein